MKDVLLDKHDVLWRVVAVIGVTVVLLILFLSGKSDYEVNDAIQLEEGDSRVDVSRREIVSEIEGYVEDGDLFQLGVAIKEVDLLFYDNDSFKFIDEYGADSISSNINLSGGATQFNQGLLVLGVAGHYIKAHGAEATGAYSDARMHYEEAYKDISKIMGLNHLALSINSSLEKISEKLRSIAFNKLKKIRSDLDALMGFDDELKLVHLRRLVGDVGSVQGRNFGDADFISLMDDVNVRLQALSIRMLRTAISEEQLFGCKGATRFYSKIIDVFEGLDLPSVASAKKYYRRCADPQKVSDTF
ncbi:MAG: hypothetical protein HN337_07385 [Deltaproteobacteria bacterium]|nr:hypothetical protein [Deltaproteobacteria bacterium]